MTAPVAPASAPLPPPYPGPGRLPPPPLPSSSVGATLTITGTILRARARAMWNSFRRGGGGGNRRRGLRLLAFAAFAVFVLGPAFWLLTLLVRYDAVQNPGEALRYPPAITLIVALVLLFSNFPATLNALYFSPTLPLLLAAPVPERTVFAVALIEGTLAAPFVLLLATLVLVACGVGIGAGIAYYLVALVGLLLTVVFVTALTQLLVTAALRVVPAQRAREILTLVGTVISVTAYGGYYLTRFGSRGGTVRDVNALHDFADRLAPVAHVLPPGWAGLAVAAAQTGDALALVGWLTASIIATLVVVEVAARVFRQSYLVGWSSVRGVAPRQEATGTNPLDRLAAMWSPQVRAIATKEIRTLVRDTKRLSVVVRSAGFALVYLAFFIFGGGSGRDEGQFPGAANVGGDAAFWGRAFFVAFVVAGVASGVSAYTFGAEGAQFALYRLAPVRPRTLLFAKWLAGAVLVAPAAVLLGVVVGVLLGGGVTNTALLALFTLWYALGATATAVATAAVGARFDTARPDRATTWTGSLLRFGVSSLFFVGSLLLWGAFLYPTTARIPGVPRAVTANLGLRAALVVVGAALAVGGLTLALRVASARVTALLRPATVEER